MESFEKFFLIAPCGMNCGICMRYLRERDKCPGCRGPDTDKKLTCLRCKIINCDFFKDGNAKFCFECDDFPCKRLQHLDARYQTRYNMSMIENLENIKNLGIDKFLADENIRWACSECGGTINVHKRVCSKCGKIISVR